MNETKLLILECLSTGERWSTPEVAQHCGLSLTNASELLRRYRGQGLVNRERNPAVPRGYLYRITDVGIDRLNYFNYAISQTGAAIADHIGLSGKNKLIFDNWVQNKLGR